MSHDDRIDRVLRHAVDRGLLSASQAAALRAEVSGDPVSIDSTSGPTSRQPSSDPPLAPAGVITTVTPSPLPTDRRLDGPARPTTAGLPIPGWARYEVIKLLGSGGMGHVYQARDPRLNRFLAIKLLRRDDPELLERFLREAQAQAQVEHENVCRVYEVGQVEGQPYIAMQLVAGRSLREMGAELNLEQKVLVIRQVALAAHAAHRTGLVHRDLKPANILLERQEDGGWHPWVVDFGLAHSVSGQGLTSPGAVVGTAAYMAPEQARGSVAHLDRRTDVYGLGATLYELLTGRPPFQAEHDVQLLMLVVNEDPIPPRRHDPGIPADLETIVLKCLEKEPQRRYDSARAVAEELQRFLDGEPILARRISRVERLARLIRKHRAMAAMLAIALAIAAASAALALHLRWQARAQARVAQEFAVDVQWMEEMLRRAYTAPPHDVRSERARVVRRLEQVATRMAHHGAVASGPGNYALGRGYLALEQFKEARARLEQAWQTGFRGPEVAWALGRVLTAEYQAALEQAQRAGSAEERERQRRAAETTYRAAALEYLHASWGAELDAPAYLEGLLAYLADRPEDALARARAAFGQLPWLYEAKRLEGEVHQSSGRRLFGLGAYDQALQEYQAAGSAYAEALEIGRSDAGVWESECERHIEVVGVHLRRGQRPLELINQAVAACSTALRINPEQSGAATKLARVYCILADHQRDHGVDPRPVLSVAVETARRAATRDPDSDAEITLGWALYQLGDHATVQGEDPRSLLAESVDAFRQAIAGNPGAVEAWNALGYALDRRARWEVIQGLDPRSTLAEAMAGYIRASELDATFALPRNNLGIAHFRRAEVERRLGGDPRPDLDHASAFLRQALAINPNYAYAWYNLAGTCRARATYLLEQGQDPTGELAEARAAFARGLAINPDVFWAYTERIETELVAARWTIATGGSPRDRLAAGRQALTTAIELNPQAVEALVAGARLNLVQAEWELQEGRDPAASVRQGLSLVTRAQGINPGRSDAKAVSGALQGVLARSHSGPQRVALARSARDILRQALTGDQLLAHDYASHLAVLETLITPR